MAKKKLETSNFKNEWNTISNKYLHAFCNKHNYLFEPDVWTGEDVGTIALINDEMYVSMDVIRYDIDNNIPEENFEKWYWKNLEIYELTESNYMNYPNFCQGAPDVWTEERIEKIREMHKNIQQAQENLQRIIDDIQNNNGEYLDF